MLAVADVLHDIVGSWIGQLGVLIGIAIGAGFGVYKSFRNGNATANKSDGGVFMDATGPLDKVLHAFDRLADMTEKIAEHTEGLPRLPAVIKAHHDDMSAELSHRDKSLYDRIEIERRAADTARAADRERTEEHVGRLAERVRIAESALASMQAVDDALAQREGMRPRK